MPQRAAGIRKIVIGNKKKKKEDPSAKTGAKAEADFVSAIIRRQDSQPSSFEPSPRGRPLKPIHETAPETPLEETALREIARPCRPVP